MSEAALSGRWIMKGMLVCGKYRYWMTTYRTSNCIWISVFSKRLGSGEQKAFWDCSRRKPISLVTKDRQERDSKYQEPVCSNRRPQQIFLCLELQLTTKFSRQGYCNPKFPRPFLSATMCVFLASRYWLTRHFAVSSDWGIYVSGNVTCFYR